MKVRRGSQIAKLTPANMHVLEECEVYDIHTQTTRGLPRTPAAVRVAEDWEITSSSTGSGSASCRSNRCSTSRRMGCVLLLDDLPASSRTAGGSPGGSPLSADSSMPPSRAYMLDETSSAEVSKTDSAEDWAERMLVDEEKDVGPPIASQLSAAAETRDTHTAAQKQKQEEEGWLSGYLGFLSCSGSGVACTVVQ